ncbi:hypothetical protein [Allonocardiopsis opalescens]|uniref:Uncharacterized protein n=1 Tax=Allonocardiopsis opalescens TaxID=1144618 RepID=A0A2T0Q2T7_9ACTN|nr:hypothetical protein [Allonocardiopsis opalescens]PRX98105.1 hypothetical protein CLV72_105458 [Allonocardiopsis opalescens]
MTKDIRGFTPASRPAPGAPTPPDPDGTEISNELLAGLIHRGGFRSAALEILRAAALTEGHRRGG